MAEKKRRKCVELSNLREKCYYLSKQTVKITDERNTALARYNFQLNVQLKNAYDAFRFETMRLDRECKALKLRLDGSEGLVEQLKSECESKERALVARRQHQEQDFKALQDSTSATVRLLHDFRERQRLDRQARLTKETKANAAFDADLVQLTEQVEQVTKRCETHLKLTAEDKEEEDDDDDAAV